MEVNGAPELLCFLHSSEYLPLCSAEQRHSYRFGTTWGWVNDDRIFIFGWTIPLNFLESNSTVCITPLVWVSSRQAVSLCISGGYISLSAGYNSKPVGCDRSLNKLLNHSLHWFIQNANFFSNKTNEIHWIIYLTDSFKNADSFRNEILCISQWIIGCFYFGCLSIFAQPIKISLK